MIFSNETPILYIAVSEYGFGMDYDPATAIRRAQEHVPSVAKPRQLLVYSTVCEWEDEEEQFVPQGFKSGCPIWQNGTNPRLVALTNTHAGFVRHPNARKPIRPD